MNTKCTCPDWWNCATRGCYEQAKAAYADVMIKHDQRMRHEGRPDHDRTTHGTPIKPGQ